MSKPIAGHKFNPVAINGYSDMIYDVLYEGKWYRVNFNQTSRHLYPDDYPDELCKKFAGVFDAIYSIDDEPDENDGEKVLAYAKTVFDDVKLVAFNYKGYIML